MPPLVVLHVPTYEQSPFYLCTAKCLVQVNDYEIVVNFFIPAITWHDIKRLSIYLPEFTQFVQLMNWQNNSCRFVYKISKEKWPVKSWQWKNFNKIVRWFWPHCVCTVDKSAWILVVWNSCPQLHFIERKGLPFLIQSEIASSSKGWVWSRWLQCSVEFSSA